MLGLGEDRRIRTIVSCMGFAWKLVYVEAKNQLSKSKQWEGLVRCSQEFMPILQNGSFEETRQKDLVGSGGRKCINIDRYIGWMSGKPKAQPPNRLSIHGCVSLNVI